MFAKLNNYDLMDGYACSGTCSCKKCTCNYTNIVLLQSILTSGAVPNDKRVISIANGFGNIVFTNNSSFFITLYIHNKLENITMAHIHLKNADYPTSKNGPIVLWLENTMKKPISISNNYLVSKNFTIADFVGPFQNTSFENFVKYVQHNMLYFNIHTVKYPDGEIAGDLHIIQEWK